MGDVLELVRDAVNVEPDKKYQKIGIRSFGKGIFHYDPEFGDELGKLRFYRLRPGELVLSNIKAWEGAIAVSSQADEGLLASNRFLTYRPIEPARADVRYVRFSLLSPPGLLRVQKASPGSADRNRTLGIAAFEEIRLPMPSLEVQQEYGDHFEELESTIETAIDDMEAIRLLYEEMFEAVIHNAFLDASTAASS